MSNSVLPVFFWEFYGLSSYIQFFNLVAQMANNLPAIQETWIHSLGWEDPLEKGMATHSSSLDWSMDRGV